MSLVGALRSAVQAMSVTQASFQIASTNIANVGTPGFSRKTAEVSTVVVDGVAAGVRLTDIQRQVDSALVRRVREQTAISGRLEVRDSYLSRIQQLFGTLADNSSLGHSLSRLSEAFEAMATAPESISAGIDAIDRANAIATQFNHMTAELQRIRLEADQEITRVVTTINTALAEIDELNRDLVSAANVGAPTGELADRRDMLVAALAKEIDIRVIERTSGEVAIYTTGGRSLIDGEVTTLAHDAASQVGPSVGYGNGIDGLLYGAAATDITTEIDGGRLAALIEVRDTLMVDLQSEIDRLAESLRAEINALHNNGTAVPAPSSLTGTQTVAAGDRPSMTGSFRVTVVDSDGVVVETSDFDLAALAPPSIGQLVSDIDAMANVAASIDAAGHVTISTAGGYRITVNELDGAVTSGAETIGMGQFLGLNDFFTAGDTYSTLLTDRVASDTAALGFGGTLTFSHNGTTTAVAYLAADSLTDIAASLNAALAGENVTATVIRESTGFRLQLEDTDGDNLFVTDSSGLASALNLRAGQVGTAGLIEVRAALQANQGLVARAESSGASGLAVGDIALSRGDGSIARALADMFTSNVSLGVAGGLPPMQARLVDYAAAIVAGSSALASSAADARAAGDSHYESLVNQAASISQVNLDEEMANIIVLQNAYGAAARVTSTASEMLDILINI